MIFRLAPRDGEWLDRAHVVSFTFEGRRLQGFAGDTISSALAVALSAAGVAYFGRSFKYHRPRSFLSFANHDSNAVFDVDGVPNVRGDVTPLREGMRIVPVNTFGGLTGDKARVLDLFGRFLPVGFYYKAFHSKKLFPRWEGLFRALTGLGKVSLDAPHEITPKRYAFCDVAVIGAGPSGLSAALAAAAAGARVALIDESFRLGGSAAMSHGEESSSMPALVAAVEDSALITCYRNTYVAGYYADHWLALAEPDRLTKLRARSVVFATGAIEQPAVFRNNDLPGVMLATAALRLASRYGIAPGRRVVMIAANAEAYSTCLSLHALGVALSGIVDLRGDGESGVEAGAVACAALGIPIRKGIAPYEAVAGSDGAVCALDVAPWSAPGEVDLKGRVRLECDAVLMSVGFAAASQLLTQAGGSTRFNTDLQQFVPHMLPEGVYAAGRLGGVYDMAARFADGKRAGLQAAAHVGCGAFSLAATGVYVAPLKRRPSHAFPIITHPQAKNFVDFDEDLQLKDLENAAQEGFDSSELMKRYSTVGMGPSQGKHSNMNALRILARVRGVGVEELGLTTARPMYHPVPMKLLAGRGFSPERRTPVDAEHAALGAVWMPAGNWRRPEYYAVAGQTRVQCIEAEVRAVRQAVGLIDVGTLGKIEIYGAQAGEFLDRVYTGRYADMKVGTTRYALMLDESGVVIDDGVIARLSAEAFYFTTTTGGSATVFRELLRWNALWGMDCGLVNVTGHRAAFNLAGPKSRDILQTLTAQALSDAVFPFLGVREATVAGIGVRLLRVGFVGELGYEIHMPAGRAAELWRALSAAGASFGLRAFGIEAQRVLRLEKGHFIIGQDSDGLTDPFEANARWAVQMKKPFFIGQRSLRVLEKRGPRQILTGFEMSDTARLPKECQLAINDGQIAGRITSVTRSTTLGKIIGLAMLDPAVAAVGGAVQFRLDDGALVAARVVTTPFYDPKNARQRPEAGA